MGATTSQRRNRGSITSRGDRGSVVGEERGSLPSQRGSIPLPDQRGSGSTQRGSVTARGSVVFSTYSTHEERDPSPPPAEGGGSFTRRKEEMIREQLMREVSERKEREAELVSAMDESRANESELQARVTALQGAVDAGGVNP